MGEDDKDKERGLSVDRVSLGIAILALAVSVFTLYYQFLQGPVVRAYRPNVVYLTRSQIGIPVAFTNAGTAADVVTDGSLKLSWNAQSPEQVFKLTWVSPFEKRISLEDGKWKEEAREYLPFSHLPLKAGDTDQEVFWFVPSAGFTFRPGPYSACASFLSVGGGMVRPGARAGRSLKEECSAWVEFELNNAQADMLSRSDQESLPIETK